MKISTHSDATVDNHTELFYLHSGQIQYNDVIGPHIQDTWELDYVKSGAGIHIFNGQTEMCNEGELILVPKGVIHNWLFDPESIKEERVDSYSLFFDFETVREKMSVFTELNEVFLTLSNIKNPVEIGGSSAREIRLLLTGMAKENHTLRVADFIRILVRLSESDNWRIISSGKELQHDTQVETVMQKIHMYLMNNYSRPISLEEVADVACMNKSAFCTFFKKHYSKSFFYALNERRINVACMLLMETPAKDVFEICLEVGFNDIPYFYRTFKKYKGCTPREYRQELSQLRSQKDEKRKGE